MAVIIGVGDFGLKDLLDTGQALVEQGTALIAEAEAAQALVAQNKLEVAADKVATAGYASAAALLLYAAQETNPTGEAAAGIIIREIELIDRANGYTFLHGGNSIDFRCDILIGSDRRKDPNAGCTLKYNTDGSIDPTRAVLFCPANETVTGIARFIFQPLAT